MGNKFKKIALLMCLVALLVSFSSIDRVGATVTGLDKEVRISLSYGGQLKEGWCNGIEAYYFGEPRIGFGIAYNVHGSSKIDQIVNITEKLRLEERSIGFLYRPLNSDDLVVKFGFKGFNYERKAYGDLSFFNPVSGEHVHTDCIYMGRDRIFGLWLTASCNKELSLLHKRIRVFGKTGLTVAKEKRPVVIDGVKESNWQAIPEFGGGLALQVLPLLRVKFGYYQVGLKGRNNFYFTSPIPNDFYVSELRASLEIAYR